MWGVPEAFDIALSNDSYVPGQPFPIPIRILDRKHLQILIDKLYAVHLV